MAKPREAPDQSDQHQRRVATILNVGGLDHGLDEIALDIGARAPAPMLALPNQRWSLDFVHDQRASGRRFRVLNIVDDVTRGCLLSTAQ